MKILFVDDGCGSKVIDATQHEWEDLTGQVEPGEIAGDCVSQEVFDNLYDRPDAEILFKEVQEIEHIIIIC